jgi:hypothetical protein
MNWNVWKRHVGKRVIGYTNTYHFIADVVEVNVCEKGVAWALVKNARQIHDELKPGKFRYSLDLGETEIPDTAITGLGVRTYPAKATEKYINEQGNEE